MRARTPWLNLACHAFPALRPVLHLVLLAAVVAAAGCYAPSIGTPECSADKQCPDGYKCDPDNKCRPNGVQGTCDPACVAGGSAPVCDLTTFKCVACLASTDCTDPNARFCDTTNKICVNCLADTDCQDGSLCAANTCHAGCSPTHPTCLPDAGACDTQLGICRGCLKDNECTDKAKPRCEPSNGVCVPCLPTNDNCPADFYCDGKDSSTYKCVAGCLPGKVIDCKKVPDGGGMPSTCCGHTCIDLTLDSKNCGACGKACANGQQCCGSGCIDPMTSVPNCGGCGKVCAPQNVRTATCAGGNCGYDTCVGLFGDCNKVTSDGCELPLDADLNNCGACGNTCVQGPHATSVACGGGKCGVTCEKGWADCDGKAETGCEVHVDVDAANCGSCGKACLALAANTDPKCAASACVVGPCKTGFADCNMSPKDGCEANTVIDAANCGGCGKTCPLTANSTTSGCAASACTVTGCADGYGDCNKKYADGCEALLNLDRANCSKCGNACPVNNICNGLGACIVSIAGGARPPTACAAGTDPETTNPFSLCQGDVNTAWFTSGATLGNYHAQQICQQYGYTQLLAFGGTCGNVCARCAAGFTCNMNQVNPNFDGGGNLGADQFGIKLGLTVMWQCGR